MFRNQIILKYMNLTSFPLFYEKTFSFFKMDIPTVIYTLVVSHWNYLDIIHLQCNRYTKISCTTRTIAQ